MEQIELNSSQNRTKLESLSKEELIASHLIIEDELLRFVRENYRLRNQSLSDGQLRLILAEQIAELKENVYGKKSERYKKPKNGNGDDSESESKKRRPKKLSERYPNIPINELFIEQDPVPNCPCCNKTMIDSDMTEDSEQLTVIPKKYEITRIKRVKYVCDCHGAIVTAEPLERIVPGSMYSDEMITDVALSKYCDLIPINRYVAMADRAGLLDLPANSLIETTHGFADFVSPVYTAIKQGILKSRVLRADETPHHMLEGDDKDRWYLWGFSTDILCYLECRDTRSGDIASDVLIKSKCEVLVSDVYTGYGKAIRVANELRGSEQMPLIRPAHCNAHARRGFFKMWPKYKEAAFYLDHYHEIYQLNSKSKGQAPPIVLELRNQMRWRFEAMRARAMEELGSYSLKGKYARALKYFLKNYDTLTYFLRDADVPIDNNAQERNLRSHVIGRKTWYGTHSKRGALTAAILFSIIETCKLNNVNPREYLKALIADMHDGVAAYTPAEFKNRTRT
jgi:transposase